MTSAAIKILSDNSGLFVDRIVARMTSGLPTYSRLEAADVRESVAGFTRDMLIAVEAGDSSKLSDRLRANSADRVSQGFSLAEYLRAMFMAPPVCREIVRELGPRNDPSLAVGLAVIEERLHELTSMAANIFTESASVQLRSKNRELNRLNQELAARQKSLTAEGEKVGRELASANEFNARVIESLASGIMAVTSRTNIVTLFSPRMEAILEIPAEDALGLETRQVFANLKGVDHSLIHETVVATGRFPLTKLTLTTSSGRKKSIFVRAQRMYTPDGENEGTVFVVDDVTERELLIDSFSRYVSRDLITRLLARNEPLGLEGERRKCTVLFADIRGFTGIAERITPEGLHRLLNDYLHVMVESIVEHGGFIDKFVGDKVMALFTGPRSAAESAFSAIEAANTIHLRIAAQNASRISNGEAPIEVGIGINTGEMVVGNVGDQMRMDFTAIGDAVNVADRLQSLAKGVETLLGAGTADLVKDRVALVDHGSQQVKGRTAPVHVFAIERAAVLRSIPND
ncbi:MAG: adenylate/guanylate cyclase domain-containing protein [Polyangiaceae bacterium]